MATEDPRIVDIVRKAKRGESKSFNYLLKMVEPDLKKICNHYFIVGADREDVMQELRLLIPTTQLKIQLSKTFVLI